MKIQVFETREDMGRKAAEWVQSKIQSVLKNKTHVNMIFAAAPSQNEFLEHLKIADIPWHQINAFHMDEYIGLPSNASQRFGRFLDVRLFKQVDFKSVHYINGDSPDPQEECARYAALLEAFPVDIVCMGIGENGHIAFNDPPVADFADSQSVKVVSLDSMCRYQQVHDGCFEAIEAVPSQAITLTIPQLMAAEYISCVVPGALKAEAVYKTVHGPIAESCPSTVLRNKEEAILFCDQHSSRLLREKGELGAG